MFNSFNHDVRMESGKETQLFEEKLEISQPEEERNLGRSGDGEWETLERKQSCQIPPETSRNIHLQAS